MTEVERIADQSAPLLLRRSQAQPRACRIDERRHGGAGRAANDPRRAHNLGAGAAYRGVGVGGARDLSGAALPTLPWEGDWPKPGANWEEAQERLKHSTDELESAMRKLPHAKLLETVPGREYSVYCLLHGVVQHNLYHAGQIALLKK